MDPMCENITMRPIGTMRSVFHYKNGTPRQSSLCEAARGILTIDKNIFNNPEHSLEGLEQFSHAWIIFVFHKNNNVHTKAKVKPPRLDGHRIGVFSTRSPYRPNNIGLSLAKIDSVQGCSVHFSGIDLLDGTPVLDIKPYIPDYDKPKDSFSLIHSGEMKDVLAAGNEIKSKVDNTDISKHASPKVQEITFNAADDDDVSTAVNKYCLDFNIKDDLVQQIVNDSSKQHLTDSSMLHVTDSSIQHITDSSIHITDSSRQHVTDSSRQNVIDSDIKSFNVRGIVDKQDTISSEKKAFSEQKRSSRDLRRSGRGSGEATHKTNTETFSSFVAPWLLNPPVVKLGITFTCEALDQLNKFSQQSSDPDYRLHMFNHADEAKRSIAEIIQEDPRSVYRRQHCQDSLYYFNIDVLHVTCWFDDGKAQVIRVKPVTLVPKLTQMSADAKFQVQGH
ncbi:unnamed protein product [Lymnaea stagnalis]|uniref:TsaA-like domain-containing protein n=1 Tax=Lymnaea stagnalis TaxID=6523 RepID=A0AAV2HD85_LYMST